MATFFQSINKSYADVPVSADGSIDTSAFLMATEDLIKLFDFLNPTAFAPVKSDMNGNVKKNIIYFIFCHDNQMSFSSPIKRIFNADPSFHVQIFEMDFVLNKPTYLDASSSLVFPELSLKQVPILRIFGLDSKGMKCCVHLHQLYPYIFIPYTGRIDPDTGKTLCLILVQLFCFQLASSLNEAISLSLNQPAIKQHIFAIILVKGISIYGYHSKYDYFLKIYYLDPGQRQRLADLLRSGAVMDAKFQPFEAHIPYTLQFLIDFNLYGMNQIHFDSILFRKGLKNRLKNSNAQKYTWPELNPNELWSELDRESKCELELDAFPWHISNRLQVKERPNEPFEPIIERNEKLVFSLQELWEDERQRRFQRGIDSQVGQTVLYSSQERTKARGVNELSSQNQTKNFSLAERNDSIGIISSFNSAFDSQIMTAFQSVTALFPVNDGTEFLPSQASSCKSFASDFYSFGKIFKTQTLINHDIILSQSKMKFKDTEDNSDVEEEAKEVEEEEENNDESFDKDYLQEPEKEDEKSEKLSISLSSQDFEAVDILENLADFISEPEEEKRFIKPTPPKPRPLTRGKMIYPAFKLQSPQRKVKKKPPDRKKPVELFNRSIKEMWSPLKQLDQQSSSFFDSPPQPTSPTLNIIDKEETIEVIKEETKVSYQLPFFSSLRDQDEQQKLKKFQKFKKLQPNDTEQIESPLKEELIADIKHQEKLKKNLPSQIFGPTLLNTGGFKFNEAASLSESKDESIQYLTYFSMELFTQTRDALFPDPKFDPIQSIVYCIRENQPECLLKKNGIEEHLYVGILMIQDGNEVKYPFPNVEIEYVENENEMIKRFCSLVSKVDPDILTGFEIQASSWGYLAERAQTAYQLDVCQMLSRILKKSIQDHFGRDNDEWGFKKTSFFHVTGRVVLNGWRMFRHELQLTSYSYQTLAYHILHKRVPKFSYETLTQWFDSLGGLKRYRVLKYLLTKVQDTILMMEEMNLIGRMSEFARVYGVPFFTVLSRGSQYKVESMMLRLAKPENLMMVSPSREEVRKMPPPSILPLVMEPEAGFYVDPILVLDFQSLYPSIMIAYNYCFSTCLGQLRPRSDYLGCLKYQCDSDVLEQYRNDLTLSTNGVGFLKKNIRQSLLAKLLNEILDTRVMIKQSIKKYKNDRSLYRRLDARQMGLKLIANVIYGYTSAGYSGRMPCINLADSIVQTAKDTLERSIDFINQNPDWQAKVIYADTDSTFVLLPGRTMERAFEIGEEIAEQVSNLHPKPIKLKFEKVYSQSVLLTKKHYVGFKYETVDQLEPLFDAKGIETVRRDGCPALMKILEASLKILFRTRNLSELRHYLESEFSKIQTGAVNLEDFIIAKAVKLGTYNPDRLPPPGAFLSLKKMELDPRQEPQYKERIPYIVAYEGPEARLVDSVYSPEDFMSQQKRLNATYYITKQLIPPLKRVFDLIGTDIGAWYRQMPKEIKIRQFEVLGKRKMKIEQFYQSSNCLICQQPHSSMEEICASCQQQPANSLRLGYGQMQLIEKQLLDLSLVCGNCILDHSIEMLDACCSIECPIYFQRQKTKKKFEYIRKRLEPTLQMEEEEESLMSEEEKKESLMSEVKEEQETDRNETIILEEVKAEPKKDKPTLPKGDILSESNKKEIDTWLEELDSY